MELVSSISHLCPMLAASVQYQTMVSNIRHPKLHDPFLETKRRRLVIVNFPYSFCGIPSTTCFFDTTLQLGFVEFDLQFDNLRFLMRRPARLFDGDFDNGAAFVPLLVIANAGAGQLSAVTFEELLCAFLTRGQCSPRLHKCHS